MHNFKLFKSKFNFQLSFNGKKPALHISISLPLIIFLITILITQLAGGIRGGHTVVVPVAAHIFEGKFQQLADEYTKLAHTQNYIVLTRCHM